MGIYKTLTPSDVTRVPFNANKLFTLNSSSAASLGINFQKFEYTTASLHTYSTTATDVSSSIKYHQLDHLFYKDNKLDIANRLGDADYLNQPRILHRRANVVSIPSGLFGTKIKPGTFQMTGSGWNIVDDKKGNLIISGTQFISHSIDEREKVFHLGPTKAFKKYNLRGANLDYSDFYGRRDPNLKSYFNEENILDDSFYTNNLDYKNITFNEELVGPNLIRDGHAPSADNWTIKHPTVISFSNDKIVFTDAAQYSLIIQQNLSFKREATYRVTYTVSGLTEGSVQSLIGAKGQYYKYGTNRSTNGTFTELLTIQNNKSTSVNAPFAFWIQAKTAGSDTNTFQISDISVQVVISAPLVNFITTPTLTSSIVAPHNELYNFNPEENFAISMYIHPKDHEGYVISKSTTKTLVKTPINTRLNVTGSSQLQKIDAREQYPFEVYLSRETNNQGTFNLINFRRSDGLDTPHISCSIRQDVLSHVVCMKSASVMSIHIEGDQKVTGIDPTNKQTENQANLYIGSKGERSNYFSGSISNVMIFNQHKTNEQIKSLMYNVGGVPYVGNMFYSNGLATITSPNYQYIATPTASTDSLMTTFKSTNTIYENEFQCTVRSDEYNYTHNISTRKIQSDQHPNLANFATGSIWKPYVTTVGLYNEDNELLVIGKLGQPIRMSDEADTTFVLRWDT